MNVFQEAKSLVVVNSCNATAAVPSAGAKSRYSSFAGV